MDITQTENPVNFQIPIEQVPRRLWDVLVVGAGPAGCATACRLAGQGYEVLLLDMARFPRDKTCGDCMITDTADSLERMNLTERIRQAGSELNGINMISPSGINFDIPGSFVAMRRRLFDTILAERAVQCGATFGFGQITNMRIEDNSNVTAEIKNQAMPVRARFGVIATGAHIGLARRLGAITAVKPSAIATRCYVRSEVSLNQLLLAYYRRILPGYGWIVPVGNNEYNIGCGYFFKNNRRVNLRRCFEDFTGEFPPVQRLLKQGEMISPLRSAPLRCALKGASAFVGESILIAGETIGTTFMLTGEGIGQAMISGELAASAIHSALAAGDRSRLKDYPTAIESHLRARHGGFATAQKWLSKRWLNDFMAARVRRSAYLRNACAAFVTKGGDARTVYSLRAVIKSFVK